MFFGDQEEAAALCSLAAAVLPAKSLKKLKVPSTKEFDEVPFEDETVGGGQTPPQTEEVCTIKYVCF